MKTIELTGDIDEMHRLQARVPDEVPAGPVRLILCVPDEDSAGAAWANGISQEWVEDLQDPTQDIYTIEDGQPVHAGR